MARYPFPWDRFLGLMRDVPAGRRSLLADCRAMVSRVEPPPLVDGAHLIPAAGPLVVAANHYQRRGLWIAWPGALITVAVATRRDETLCWLVTGGLRWMQWRDAGPEVPGTRRLFRRVASTYGMTALPLTGRMERAAAIRSWLDRAEEARALGVFPEGLAGGSGGLRAPERGFDVLCHVLARSSVPFLPCGVFEREGRLHVYFGEPVCAREGDEVMRAIAQLLPPDLRGAYAQEETAPASPRSEAIL